VTNDDAASLGTARESNAEFRARRDRSVALPGSNQVDNTFARIANVDDVNQARIYENRTSSTDGNGVDPHSMAIFVDGGDTVEVAEAIARTKAPGCGLNADNTFPNKVQKDVETEQGSPLTVTFYRPELKTIYIEIELEGEVSTSTVEAIKQGIIDYASADYFGSGVTGFDRSGFSIGESVYASKLYTPVNRAIESDAAITSLLIGTDSGSVNQTQIDPGFNGLAVFDKDAISVTVL
jgi:hypothetical protein